MSEYSMERLQLVNIAGACETLINDSGRVYYYDKDGNVYEISRKDPIDDCIRALREAAGIFVIENE